MILQLIHFIKQKHFWKIVSFFGKFKLETFKFFSKNLKYMSDLRESEIAKIFYKFEILNFL